MAIDTGNLFFVVVRFGDILPVARLLPVLVDVGKNLSSAPGKARRTYLANLSRRGNLNNDRQAPWSLFLQICVEVLEHDLVGSCSGEWLEYSLWLLEPPFGAGLGESVLEAGKLQAGHLDWALLDRVNLRSLRSAADNARSSRGCVDIDPGSERSLVFIRIVVIRICYLLIAADRLLAALSRA